MEISKWIKKLDELNDKLDELESDIELAGHDKISVDQYNKINSEIDATINSITALQANIEEELVKRALTEAKAKAFVDEEKLKNQEKIDEKQVEIDELKGIDKKFEKNEDMQKANVLIQKRFDLQDKNRELEKDKEKLEKEKEKLEKDKEELEKDKEILKKEKAIYESINKDFDKQIEELMAKIDDKLTSDTEKMEIMEKIRSIKSQKEGSSKKIESIDKEISDIEEKILNIEEKILNIDKNISSIDKNIDNNINGDKDNDINGDKDSIKTIDDKLAKKGVLDSDDKNLIAIMKINNQRIRENRIDIRKDAKDKLGIEEEFVSEDEIKAILDEKLRQSEEEMSRLEERGVGFDEKALKNKVMEDLNANSIKITKPQELEDIVSKVVNERKEMLNPTRTSSSDASERISGGGSGGGTRRSSNLPVPVTSKSKNKVGFFRNLYETMFSKEFKDKRLDLAHEMYPELSEKQIKKYINDHTDVLNNMIRNDVTVDDIEEAKLIQKAQREERMNRNNNNDFIKKLRETIRTGGDLDSFAQEQVDERAKKAKESLESDRDER